MKQQRNLNTFNDILIPRRKEFSNFMWVSRKLNSAVAVNREVKPSPLTIKQNVLDSVRMQEIIDNVCATGDVSKTEMVHQIKLILDEIGFKKQIKVIRWLGYVLAKICQRICYGIYVNNDGMNRLKAQMGSCPVIFAPSHRSYADFILMSYLLFTYDIEIPSIAAGMDFHGMIGMGTVLRNTGAFFMRRSYNDDKVYWDTFKTYVHHLITKGELPIEFFIEGTRSRSCKSLVPKFGLLSMMLKPFFTSEVPDILIVPINISYDRVLEERLFAFELLGIPKPKESTSGFFKSLSLVREKYGNIYIDFAEPISCKKYFGEKLVREKHVGPIHKQELLPIERSLISSIAYDTVHVQQNNTVITAFNIMATLISNNIILKKQSFIKIDLEFEMRWLKKVMETFGALVSIDYETLEETLIVHKNFVETDKEGRINLICTSVDLTNVNPNKLKGHSLSNETMTRIVPLMMLQLYVNPCLHFLVNSSLIVVIMKSMSQNRELSRDELYGHFQFLRMLFAYEFVFHEKWENMDFEDALKQLRNLHVIEESYGNIVLTNNEKLQTLLCNMLLPFFSSYHTVCHFLQTVQIDNDEYIEQNTVLKNVQKILEQVIMQVNVFVHPYCLNLDTLGICLQSLASMKILEQQRKEGKLRYKRNVNDLKMISEKIGKYSDFYNIPATASVLLSSKL